ncbi:sufE-like protein 2, chloroplastic [Lycium ferocissimum]|uniref:sufE-like protein 2, chloroplastic n=1 Tax=Lycium ferocissimum TaxID=112874 RepID=UPI002815963F|nr:sufE-like protein 2, chloroplastic [Lycium ferocissimum]
MHSSINLKHSSLPFPLTISSIPTKSNPQFPPKNPIFFTSLKNPSTFLTISSTPTKPNPHISHKKPIFFTSMQYSANRYYSNSSSRTKKPNLSSVSCLIMEEPPFDERLSVADKVQSLSLEFRSLSEPIDRVKRLLHYASILPPLNESSRLRENRVFGCTTQVWLEVRMDNKGYMRFRVDSDSEITKGFCSCLIWVLDGAKPEEILSVTAEDLADMNVGLPKKGRSRVNTWHNVLFSMQNRTQDCVQERNRALPLEDPKGSEVSVRVGKTSPNPFDHLMGLPEMICRW